ncbi:MAG: hypothetical protein K8S98_08985 [Planctomycetes bacterium]|nr:hypothetical protein [Planctomycetota bacterium]
MLCTLQSVALVLVFGEYSWSAFMAMGDGTEFLLMLAWLAISTSACAFWTVLALFEGTVAFPKRPISFVALALVSVAVVALLPIGLMRLMESAGPIV